MDNSIKNINIEDLIPGEFQAHFENIGDNIDNLTNSIKNYGILVPLLVRPKGVGQYEIILGNRRYSAARNVGLSQVPAIIIDADDEKCLDIVISDNIQRRELTSKEEGYLYDKDLEFKQNNEETLSNKLGIPKDRILSKLNFVRKSFKPKNNISNNNIEKNYNNTPNNSSINQDIMNLTELNKEEEREEINMNNNIINNTDQNINYNPNTNLNDNVSQNTSQEPTFGGRFFPSLEDEPTNMNVGNQSFSPINEPTNSEGLIDLTGSNNNIKMESLPDINLDPMSVPNLNQSDTNYDNNNSLSNIEQVNNPPQPEGNFNMEQVNSVVPPMTGQNPMVPPTIEATQVNNPGEVNPIMTPEENINIPDANTMESPIPEATQVNNPAEVSLIVTPEENINIPETNTMESPIPEATQINNPGEVSPIVTPEENINIPAANPMVPPIPEATQVNNPAEVNPIMTPEENINIPDANPMESPIPEATQINNLGENNPNININNNMNQVSNTNQQDVIPIINMIKSLAVNIENLGYKLNITESENNESYSINIEVEK